MTFYLPNYVYYYSVYIFPLLLMVSYHYADLTTFIIPFITFLIVPILELILGDDNTKNEEETNENENIKYLLPIYIWPIVQISLLYYFLQGISNFNFFDLIVFSVSVGIVNGGIGINVSHELIHKRSFLEKNIGKLLLCSVCYGHFYIEHIWGHHLNVGKYSDNATSRINESIYSFIPRSIIGSYKNSHRIGSVKKINPVDIFTIISVLYLSLSLILYGIYGLIFIFIQSLVAIIMLESANYIEHYGLVRSSDETVNIFHSWNTNKKITNYITFRLQIHSDHHIDRLKGYQNLKYEKYYPTLPTGYTGSILIAFIPPLWFYIMNKKLKEYTKKMF